MLKRVNVLICGLGFVLVAAGAASAQSTTDEAKAKTKAAAHKTVQYVSDAEITTAIKAKLLADQKTSALKIGVETTKGVVTLDGPVSGAAEKNEAIRLAKKTSGVKRVVSKLRIEKRQS